MMDIFPQWVDDVFLIFSVNYEGGWIEGSVDERSMKMKKLLWFDCLKRFTPEIILKAARECIRDYPTFPPKAGEVFAICDQMAKAGRYVEHQISNEVKVGAYRDIGGSQMLSWWTQEDAKRAEGRLNALDIQDIKNALEGVLNVWAKVIPGNRSFLERFVRAPESVDWPTVLAMKPSK